MSFIKRLSIGYKLKHHRPFELKSFNLEPPLPKPDYGNIGIKYKTKDERIMEVTAKITSVVYEGTTDVVSVEEFLACLEKERK